MKKILFTLSCIIACLQGVQAQEVPLLKHLAAQQLAHQHNNAIFPSSLVKKWQKQAPAECIDLIAKQIQKKDYTNLNLNKLNGAGSYFGTVFSPDNKIFATTEGGIIHFYSTAEQKLIGNVLAHNDVITDCLFLDDYTVVSSSRDRTVKIWDVKTDRAISDFVHDAPVKAIKCSADSQWLYAFLENGAIWVWSLKTHERVHTIQVQFDVSELFYDKIFDSQKSKVIFIEPDNSLIIVNLLTAQVKRTVPLHEFTILETALSPDERYLATASSDHTVKICDLHTGTVVQEINGHTDAVFAVIYSNNNEIVTASKDGSIKRWNIENGLCLSTFLVDNENTIGLYLFDNGKKIISCSDNGCLRIWNRFSGQCIKKIQVHSSAMHYVKFLSKDCLLTASFTDGTLKVWNLSQGACHFCRFITDRKTVITDIFQTKIKVSSDKNTIVVVDNQTLNIVQSPLVDIEKPARSWIHTVALLAPTGLVTAAVLGALTNFLSYHRS